MVVSDQWRLGPAGVVLGLDWPAVDVLLRASGTSLDAELLDALRVMEGTVLDTWAERRGRSGAKRVIVDA